MGWKKIAISKEDYLNPKDLEIKFLKDRTKITSDYINTLSYKIKSHQDQVNKLTLDKYLYYIDYFSNKYGNMLNKISKFVGEIDFYKSNAKSAILYGYNKPKIDSSLSNNSYINSKGLRHPIIERIQTDIGKKLYPDLLKKLKHDIDTFIGNQ